MKHAVIEDASVELLELFDKVSKEARKEKLAIPPLNKMMYYWTRKPLIVGRAVALASTLDDVEDVKKLLHLEKNKRAFTYKPDLGIYTKKLGQSPSNIKTLDPFAGGGNLIFESKNLGLDCTASDYNPLAYLLEKSVLEYPLEYGPKLIEDFEKFANHIIQITKEEIGKFYGDDDLLYLWCWCISCPHCEQRIPLTNNHYLIDTKKKRIGIRFHVTKNKDFTTELVNNMPTEECKQYTQKGGKALCISCKNSINQSIVKKLISVKQDREMLVIQKRTNGKKYYELPKKEDKERFNTSQKYLKQNMTIFETLGLIPFENIQPSHQDTLSHFGIKQWYQFYSDRQLLVPIIFIKNSIEFYNNSTQSKKMKIILLYLGLLLCRHINRNTLGTVWHKGKETPEHSLTMRRPAFVYNHPEINPFNKVSGSFENVLKNILDAIKFVQLNKGTICVKNESVTVSSNNKFDLIITDPPYGNDVQYGELSELFYVWLYRILKHGFNEIPSKIPIDEDFCESKLRFSKPNLAKEFFEHGFKKSFVSMNDKLKDDGLLVVFFAHSGTDAWNILLESIGEANFKVVSSYSIHTESEANVIAKGKTSFMSSIVVVCRKILQPSEAYFEDLIPQIEDKIKNMLKQIPDEKLLALPITDLLIMVYGKVLEASTQHTTLKSYQKNFPPNFENLIKGARSFIMKELVGKITGKSLNVIGPRMAFYLLIKMFHKGIIGGDDASKISQIYDIKIENLEKDQVVIKDKDIIRLHYLNENEMDYSPDNVEKSNLHQQLCYLAYTADSRSLDKIPTILSMDNFRAEDLKQVISLLIQNYHLRRNKGESLNPKEQRELDILESLGDTVGVKVEGTMDSFL